MKLSTKLILTGLAGITASAVFIDVMFGRYPITGITLFVLSVITIIIGLACTIGS